MSYVVERQSYISILERNIEGFSFTNIIFQGKINADQDALRTIKLCLSKERLIRYLTYILTVLSVVIIIGLMILLPILFKFDFFTLFIVFMTLEYFFIMLIGTLLFYPPRRYPYEYYVFIHDSPRLPTSVIILRKYLPRGQDISSIPIKHIDRVVYYENIETRICKNIKVSYSECKLFDKHGHVLSSFGKFGDKNDLKKIASELWRFILSTAKSKK